MQPVSLFLEGQYWDCQIYSGELTLFGAERSFHRIKWSDLIDEMASEYASIQTALRVAFSDSDLFYTQKVRKILRDPDIERVIKNQLTELSKLAVKASKQSWKKFWSTTDSPFDFLPIDTDIYYHHLFAAGEEGLFSTFRFANGRRSGRQSSHKHHDGRVLQVRASQQSTAVAAAAGSDGLLEFTFNPLSNDVLGDQQVLAKRPCNACDWAFQSIFAWDATSAFLANFRREKDPRSNKSVRIFDSVIGEEKMFPTGHNQTTSYVWGSHEKIFKVSSVGLEVLNYTPPPETRAATILDQEKKPESSLFRTLGTNKFVEIDPSQIVATGTAPFGSIVELGDRLVVLRSDGDTNTFLGEPVHWRVYPRSEHYSNQLHIVYEDHIQIVSFVHDYFVEQRKKLTGFAKGSNDYIVG